MSDASAAKQVNTTRRLLISALMLTMMVLSGSGLLEKGLDRSGLNHLDAANATYLEESFDRSIQLFAVLSAIKVALAIVEGSEVGVGFGLELGDIVQSVYDHVDIAWKTVLAAGVVLKGLQYLLTTADFLDQLLLTLALGFIWLMLMLRWWRPQASRSRRITRDGALLLSVLAAALYLLLPLSVAGGHWLSNQITAPSLTEAEEGLSDFKSRIDELAVNEAQTAGIFGAMSNAKDRVVALGFYLQSKATDIIVFLLTIMAVYLFDCIVFPLVTFLFLLWFTRLCARYLFGIRKEQNMREDLEAVLSKFHEPRATAKG